MNLICKSFFMFKQIFTDNKNSDVSNHANVLLTNLKEIVDKLLSENAYYKTQVEKLMIEKKQLIVSNKNLTNKVRKFEKDLQKKISL